MNVADDISSRLSNSQSPGPSVFVEVCGHRSTHPLVMFYLHCLLLHQEVFLPHDEVEHIESASPTVIADDIDQHQR